MNIANIIQTTKDVSKSLQQSVNADIDSLKQSIAVHNNEQYNTHNHDTNARNGLSFSGIVSLALLVIGGVGCFASSSIIPKILLCIGICLLTIALTTKRRKHVPQPSSAPTSTTKQNIQNELQKIINKADEHWYKIIADNKEEISALIDRSDVDPNAKFRARNKASFVASINFDLLPFVTEILNCQSQCEMSNTIVRVGEALSVAINDALVTQLNDYMDIGKLIES